MTYPDGLPDVLREVVPQVGDLWIWEPTSDTDSQVVWVTDVTWDGAECKIESELVGISGVGGERYWNSLGRWVESTVLMSPAEDTNCASCGHPKFQHVANELSVVQGQVGFRGGCRRDWKKWPPGEDCGCPGYLAPRKDTNDQP